VLDPENIVGGLLRGALSGRKKSWKRTGRAVRGSGLVNAKTLLAAAGVAWGLYETWQAQQARPAPATGGPATAPPLPGGLAAPPPLPGAPPDAVEALPAPVMQLLRLMVSAARADGELGPAERERILGEAREVGAEEVVMRELDHPRPLGEVVKGVSDPQFKEQLYTLAYTIVRADETVTGGERIYLAQLASRLGLAPDQVARLEGEAASRIDAVRETGD
jgi:uncharacterized membrane protein YebE (DUF533 family)